MKIKKCPKCKSHKIKITDDIEYVRGGYYCECKKCGYCLTDIYASEESAIEA